MQVSILRLAFAASWRLSRLASQSAQIEPFEHSFLGDDENTCWN
jgi:hypothetical protein